MIRLRRVDWSIWAAFAAGGLALVASLLLILHGLKSWSTYSGMRVHPRAFLHFYTLGFRVYFTFAIPAVLLLAAGVCRCLMSSKLCCTAPVSCARLLLGPL